MPEHGKIRVRRWGHSALVTLLAVVGGGVLLLWAWNTLAVDLFGLPAARFKHALALEAGIAALTLLPLGLARALRRGPAPTP